MIVATGSWIGFAEFEGVIDATALEDDIHAGDSETSAMLAARPELVDADQARNFVSATGAWKEANRFIGLTGRAARPAWIIDDLNVDGACGDASAPRQKRAGTCWIRRPATLRSFWQSSPVSIRARAHDCPARHRSRAAECEGSGLAGRA